jgi:hypothetical protein
MGSFFSGRVFATTDELQYIFLKKKKMENAEGCKAISNKFGSLV